MCKSEKNAWLNGMRNEEGKERGMVEKERGKAENRKEMMEKEKGDGGGVGWKSNSTHLMVATCSFYMRGMKD